MFFDAAIVVDIAAEQTSSYVLVTFDADETVIILEGGGQLPLVWRQVGWCRSVILFSSALEWVPISVWDVEAGDV